MPFAAGVGSAAVNSDDRADLTLCCTQISLGVLVATSTANRVAVLRTLPAIFMRAPDTGGCCSASPSRRVLTLWSWSTSFRIASKPWAHRSLAGKPKVGGFQMDWLRSEDLKEEKGDNHLIAQYRS